MLLIITIYNLIKDKQHKYFVLIRKRVNRVTNSVQVIQQKQSTTVNVNNDNDNDEMITTLLSNDEYNDDIPHHESNVEMSYHSNMV